MHPLRQMPESLPKQSTALGKILGEDLTHMNQIFPCLEQFISQWSLLYIHTDLFSYASKPMRREPGSA